jgi:glucose/arabinose dehydrogenase/mono/diheme cytochrome c family protein
MRSILALASAAVFGVACLANPEATGGPAVPAPTGSSEGVAEPIAVSFEQRRVNIPALYAETCAKCHGAGAEGGGAGTPSLISEAKYAQELDKPFFDIVKNGMPDGSMDAYGQTMDDETIWGLVVYVRELQGRGLRAVTGSPKPSAASPVVRRKSHSYRVENVVDGGLSTPWGIDWLKDGRFLVTNRNGVLSLYNKNYSKVGDVTGLPAIAEMGQGGLMEVAVHPAGEWIYLGFTDPGAGGTGMTKIVRGKLSGLAWTGEQTIYKTAADQYQNGGRHFGNRIVFDGKGHIFFAQGDRGRQELAQDLSRSNGKVFRVKEDGSIPSDNPYVGRAGANPAIWSFGHRNPQGLVIDTQGNLWNTEHGPRGGDELNMVRRGGNYGWPVVAFSINYNGAPGWTPWPKEGQNISMPAYRWMPSIGACGMDLVRGPMFPNWKGDILAGGLAGQNVDRIRVKDGKMVEREEILHGMGRVREVATAPDGSIWVALNGPDRIIRLVQAG